MPCLRSRCAWRRLRRAGRLVALTAVLPLASAGCRTTGHAADLADAPDAARRGAAPAWAGGWQQAAAVQPRSLHASATATAPAIPPPMVDPGTPPPAPAALAPPAVATSVLPAPVVEDLSGAQPPADREAFKLVTVDPVVVVPAPAAAPAHTYVVKPGDTLASIARSVYGNEQAWTRLYEANKDRLPDAGRIKPGMTLRLP